MNGDSRAQPARIALNFTAIFLFYIAEYALHALLPVYLTEYLGHDRAYAGYFTAISAISSLLADVFSGATADRYGKMPLYIISLAAMGVTVAFYGAFSGVLMLLSIRFMHGFFGGFVTSISHAAMISMVPSGMIGRIQGFIGVFMMLAMMVASPLAFIYIEHFSITSVFVVTAVLLIFASFIISRIKIIEPPHQRRSVSLSMFMEPRVFHLALLRMLSFICRAVFTAYGVIYARQAGFGNAGAMLTFYALGSLISRPLCGWMLDRFSRPAWLLIINYLLMATGYFVFSMSPFVGAFIIGLGADIILLPAIAFKAVEPEAFAKASATMEASRSVGLIIGSFLTGALYTGALGDLFSITAFFCLLPIAIIIVYRRKNLI